MAIHSKNGTSLNKISAYFNKMAFNIKNAWSLKSMAPIAFIIALFFAFSSCEEEDLEEDEQQTTVLQSFAGKNNSLRIIGSDELTLFHGKLMFLSTGRDSIAPKETMLFIPERAYEDDVVKPSEILTLIMMPDPHGPYRLKKGVSGHEGHWLRFTGKEFMSPLEPLESKLPGDLSSMEVLFYSEEQQPSDFLGNMKFSDYQIPWPSADETKNYEVVREIIALAVPASQLLNINMELSTNLSGVINEPASAIKFPTETGASVADGVIGGQPVVTDKTPFTYASVFVSGENFFPDETFIPSTVSVLTAPITEVLEKTSASRYADTVINSDTRILFFTSDYFVEPPYDIYTVTEPGEELDVSNTQVVLAPSVMNINQGLTLAISPGKLSLTDNLDGTYWPKEYYHPGGFEFPSVMYPPETSPELLPIRFSGYAPEAIQQMGVMVQPEGLR